ncbi:MAG: glycoside hydrolase family 16 protein [Bacteroidaceae bacterium]|nr:glycoside hydrolase family 16 protein [Bacteroidaceae bacterium]MBR1799923.1 glycoside hydrolase family 16 protein [Bacteroidaceae bacterium]
MRHRLFLLAALCTVASAAVMAQPVDSLTLVWHDEFDYIGHPDSARWQYEHGFVRNQELQWYQPDNARVIGGVLQITARHEQVMNPNYKQISSNWKRNRPYAEFTSSCVMTRDRFSFRYGRLEVRARIPVASGAWPAIWTLGNRWGWPACGEIDVMEFYRVPPQSMGIHHTDGSRERTLPIILANACWQDANGRDAWDTSRTPLTHFTDRDPAWATQFHVWRMDWTPDAIRLYLDDELLNDIPTAQAAGGGGWNHDVNPFANDVPGFGHYILLNLAIGSSGGTPDLSAFPMVYEIDYVRVYQRPHH